MLKKATPLIRAPRLVRLRCLAWAMGLLVPLGWAGPETGLGVAERKYVLKIPAGEADESLRALAHATEVGIFFAAAMAEGTRTQAVRGRFRVAEALDLMLEGTGLQAVPLSGGVSFAIVKGAAAEASAKDRAQPSNPTTQPTETTQMKDDSTKTLRALISALLAAGSGLSATAQEQEGDDGIYELSPFVITAEEDQGYRATTTLSGTRLKTQLSDVGAAISVYTKEFLEDTGSHDLEDLLVYAANTEVPGTGGNITNLSTTFQSSLTNQDSIVRPQNNTRVRGLSQGDLTRDLYLTDIPFDSYNIDRVTINRGSNNILFGLGSPAGIIDSSLVKAGFFNSTSIELAADSFDGTRASLDVNRELSDDQLAVRIAALYEDKRFDIDPTYERDERVFGTVTYRPWDKATIRANFEAGSVMANRPRISPPIDQVSPYFEPTAFDYPTQLDAQGRPFHDAGNEARQTLFWSAMAALFTPQILIDNGQSFSAESFPGFEVVVFGVDQEARPDFPSEFFYSQVSNRRARVNREGLPFSGFYVNPQISDPGIFDFNSLLLDGPNKDEWRKFDTYNVTFEQLFLEGHAGVEVAYDYQDYEDGHFWVFDVSRNGEQLSIDGNTTTTDGRPNPHFAKPIITGNATASERYTERDAFRAQAFIEHNFSENSDGLAAWLGRHVLTGQFFTQEIDEKRIEWNNAWAWGPDRAQYINFGGANSRNITSDPWRAAGVYTHLGNAVPNANPSTLGSLNIPNIQSRFRIRDSESVYVFDEPNQEWRLVNLSSVTYHDDREGLASGASLANQEIDSWVGILQSWWLDSNVVTTVGFRRDEASGRSNDAPPRDPVDRHVIFGEDFFNLDGTDTNEVEGEVWSWSVVGKVPHGWLDAVPGISSLSVSYQESENFQPAANRTDIFGNPIGAPTGTTEDIGLSFGFAEDKISLRINWYETSENDVTLSDFPGIGLLFGREAEFIEQMDAMLANEANLRNDPRYADLPPFETVREFIDPQTGGPLNMPQEILDLVNFSAQDTDGDGYPDSITDDPPSNAVSTSDRVSEGVEVELTANPTNNWTLMLNVAQQKVSRANSGLQMKELIAQRLPIYERFGAFPINAAGGLAAGDRWIGEVVVPARKVFAQDGREIADEIREWRVNLATNYTFSENAMGGRLDGFSVGGGLRWQDDVAIGFLGKVDPELGEILDVDSPVIGDSDMNIDLWFGYQRKIWDDKIDWKLQLNVRNALDEDDLIPAFANPDGTVAGYRIQQGRKFELTSRFEF